MRTAAIAKLQVALGAVGLCCQKVGEAEVMAAAGIPNILVITALPIPRRRLHQGSGPRSLHQESARRLHWCFLSNTSPAHIPRTRAYAQVSNEVVSPSKLRKLAVLSKTVEWLGVCADNQEAVDRIEAACAAEGAKLDVLVSPPPAASSPAAARAWPLSHQPRCR